MTLLTANMPYQPRVQFAGEPPPLESIYRQLQKDEFRLLHVMGYDDYGILRCSLRHMEFREDTEHLYTAISYTWDEAERIWYGDYDTSAQPIRVDGTAVLVSNKVANIISTALQHGRQLLWIDAVCINQADVAEKSHQVTRMGAIYGCASEVLSFLGSPSNDTDKILEQANNHFHTPIQKFSTALFTSFLKLLSTNYWRRAWVFQEIALARSLVLCWGSKLMSWDTFMALAERLGEFIEEEGSNLRKLMTGLKLAIKLAPEFPRFVREGASEVSFPDKFAAKGAVNPFLQVLHISHRHRQCQDPPDLLYSRMALATDCSVLIPYPDYHMPVEELFRRFATNHIIQTGSLEVITFAKYTDKHLPSWTPDWSCKEIGWDPNGMFKGLGEALSPLTWNNQLRPRISQCRTEMIVQGKTLMTIKSWQLDEIGASKVMSRTRHFCEYPPPSEIPRRGDLICALRGCPLLVFLRPVRQHYIIVG